MPSVAASLLVLFTGSIWVYPLAAQTHLGGWDVTDTALLRRLALPMNDRFGAIPDTLERTPRQIRISFHNPPFAPIWATLAPNGGTVCHDLGLVEKEVAKPIAAYVYQRSPDQAVDTVTVVFHKRMGYQAGYCSSSSYLRFRPTELLPGIPPTRIR